MKIWIVSVGEPLPTDENARIRRMGILGNYISKDESNVVEWFSASFDHYKKTQRVLRNTTIEIKDNYIMHLIYTNGYKKNISFARIRHHISAGSGIYKEMMSMKDLPDVILASSEPLEVSHEAMKYAKQHDIPIVMDVRDLWPDIYYEAVPSKMRWLMTPYVKACQLIHSSTMQKATGIVGLSQGFLEHGLKYAKRNQTNMDAVIPIAYPNYDYHREKDDYSALERKYGIVRGDFVILFLGNFGNQFDFAPIIEASKELIKYDKIKFVLAGTGIQMEMVKNQVEHNVIFTGWIEKNDILHLAANANLGIAPYIDSINYKLNTPNKFGEYLSASLPPIISVDGVMDNLICKKECGARYRNGKELAQIILDFYNNPQKQKRYSINARSLYMEMFEEDTVNERFYQYLKYVYESRKKK